MSPATVLLILQLMQAIIAAAPSVAEGIIKAKKALEAWFTAGILTKAEQDRLSAGVDALGVLAALGVPPPHWAVEPDPAP